MFVVCVLQDTYKCQTSHVSTKPSQQQEVINLNHKDYIRNDPSNYHGSNRQQLPSESRFGNSSENFCLQQQITASNNKREILLDVGERVVWFSGTKAYRGVVCWLEQPGEQGKPAEQVTVGLEFDEAIGTSIDQCGCQQRFHAKEGHGALVPIIELMKEDDFDGKSDIAAAPLEEGKYVRWCSGSDGEHRGLDHKIGQPGELGECKERVEEDDFDGRSDTAAAPARLNSPGTAVQEQPEFILGGGVRPKQSSLQKHPTLHSLAIIASPQPPDNFTNIPSEKGKHVRWRADSDGEHRGLDRWIGQHRELVECEERVKEDDFDGKSDTAAVPARHNSPGTAVQEQPEFVRGEGVRPKQSSSQKHSTPHSLAAIPSLQSPDNSSNVPVEKSKHVVWRSGSDGEHRDLDCRLGQHGELVESKEQIKEDYRNGKSDTAAASARHNSPGTAVQEQPEFVHGQGVRRKHSSLQNHPRPHSSAAKQSPQSTSDYPSHRYASAEICSAHSSPTKPSDPIVALGAKDLKGKTCEVVVPVQDLLQQYIGEGKGIEGKEGMSGLISLLYAWFQFPEALDWMLVPEASKEKVPCYSTVQEIIRDKIVKPLRVRGMVCAAVVNDLFAILKGFSKDTLKKDRSEESLTFYISLIVDNILQCGPLNLSLHAGVVHLCIHPDSSPNLCKIKFPTTERVLREELFHKKQTFNGTPKALHLICKIEGLHPALNLDLSDMVDGIYQPCTKCQAKASVQCFECLRGLTSRGFEETYFCDECSRQKHSRHIHHAIKKLPPPTSSKSCILHLAAVVCYQNRFITFAKCHKGPDASWVKFDSMVDSKHFADGKKYIPEVHQIDPLEDWLDLEHKWKLSTMTDVQMPMDILLMCKYGRLYLYVKED